MSSFGGAPAPDPRPPQVRATSTRVNCAASARCPLDDVGVYLVAAFGDVLTRREWGGGRRWQARRPSSLSLR